MEFSGKLVYIMDELGIKSAELARGVNIDPAQVSRWRAGKRPMNDERMLGRIGAHIASALRTDRQRAWMRELMKDYDAEGGDFARMIALWLMDDKPIRRCETPRAQPEGMCFLGVEGFLTAVSMLTDAAERACGGQPACAYISSEQMQLILDPRTLPVWKRLHALCGEPVPVVLEQSLDFDRMSEVLILLMPHLQAAGTIALSCLPSSERRLCYSATIHIKGVGLVMVIEPPGANHGDCVSMFVRSPGFVAGIGEAMAKLAQQAKPLLRLIRGAADERAMVLRCFDGSGALAARHGGVNLLYAPEEAYRALLKANRLGYDARRHHLQRFSEMRQAFEGFLASGGHYRELVSLRAIAALPGGACTMPDLGFAVEGRLTVPPAFAAALIAGMTEFQAKYDTLSIMLMRDTGEDAITRIKEDSHVVLQMVVDGRRVCAASEHWLMISEHERQFEASWNSGEGIYGRSHVAFALNRKLNRTRNGWEDE